MIFDYMLLIASISSTGRRAVSNFYMFVFIFGYNLIRSKKVFSWFKKTDEYWLIGNSIYYSSSGTVLCWPTTWAGSSMSLGKSNTCAAHPWTFILNFHPATMELINPMKALTEGQGSYLSSKISDSLQSSPCDGYITHICNITTCQVLTTQMGLTGKKVKRSCTEEGKERMIKQTFVSVLFIQGFYKSKTCRQIMCWKSCFSLCSF